VISWSAVAIAVLRKKMLGFLKTMTSVVLLPLSFVLGLINEEWG